MPETDAEEGSSDKHKEECLAEDRLSKLPDKILVSILSLMTLREASSTYVLSKRWQAVWENIISLNFEATKTTFGIDWDPKLWYIERPRYIDFVNQILKIHKHPTIDDFRVRFYLNQNHKCDIDRWLDFAIKKRVRKLKMNFKPVSGFVYSVFGEYRKFYGACAKYYTFSNNSYEYIKSPQGLFHISSLTSLCLRYVNVSGEIIEHFLSNCPFLKKLAVEESNDLVNLKIVASTSPLALQRLVICSCSRLEELEICAPFLVSFRYFGSIITINIHDVPHLVDISIGGLRHQDPTFAVSLLSSYFCNLETLMLTMKIDFMKFSNLPELTSLKTLIVEMHACRADTYNGLIPLINACPLMNKLTFKLFTWPKRRRVQQVLETPTIPHKNLKVVEMVGFIGCKLDMDIAQYMLDTALVLEKLVIDCRWAYVIYDTIKFWNGKQLYKAKRRAFKLKAKEPSKVEVVHVIKLGH